MKSAATRRFWELFHALPAEVQKLAVKNYELWRANSNHPSLHFRLLQGSKDRLRFVSELTIGLLAEWSQEP